MANGDDRERQRGGGIAAGAARIRSEEPVSIPGALSAAAGAVSGFVGGLQARLDAARNATGGFTDSALGAGQSAGAGVRTGARSTAETPSGVGSRTTAEIRGGEVTQRVTAPRQSTTAPPARFAGGGQRQFVSGGAALVPPQGRPPPPTALPANRYELVGRGPGQQPLGRINTPQGQATFQYGTGRFGGTTSPSAFRSGGGVSVVSSRTPQQQAIIDRQVASFDNARRQMEALRLERRGVRGNRALTGAEQARLAELEGEGRQGRQQRAKRRGEEQERAFEQNLALRRQAGREAEIQQGNVRLQIDIERARQAREAGEELDPLTERYLSAFEEAERMNQDAFTDEDRIDPRGYAESILSQALRLEGVAIHNGRRINRADVELMAQREGVPVAEFARANGIFL